MDGWIDGRDRLDDNPDVGEAKTELDKRNTEEKWTDRLTCFFVGSLISSFQWSPHLRHTHGTRSQVKKSINHGSALRWMMRRARPQGSSRASSCTTAHLGQGRPLVIQMACVGASFSLLLR